MGLCGWLGVHRFMGRDPCDGAPMNAALRKAFQFFLKHAGYIVGQRAAGALSLARAEQWATDNDLEYVWSDDPDTDLGDHELWCANARRRQRKYSIPPETRRKLVFCCEHYGYQCLLVRPCPDHGTDCKHAEVLAALGGILDPDNNYRRIVEAELALDAKQATRSNHVNSEKRLTTMAHNLSTYMGQISMAYFGQTPWHKLGQRLTDAARRDVPMAMDAAGLTWTVRREPLYLADGRKMDDRQAIVRDTDNAIFGTVGARFTPIQNVDAFGVLTDVIQDAGVTIESAGAIGNGATVWMLARFAEGREITKGDVVNPYFLISQAHDGSRAYGARLTPIRVVCQNTLNAATSAGVRGNEITIRHTAKSADRLAEARRIVKRLTGVLDETIETYQALASVNVSDDDVRQIIATLFLIADNATAEVKAKQTQAMMQVGLLARAA
jgi:phage/plasmid-like protein (TIGR03299 family)